MSAGSARIRKRSVTIGRHRTSVSLEAAFWSELTAIAARRGLSLNALVAEIDRDRIQGRDLRTATNLSSALRLHVLQELKRAADVGAGTTAEPQPPPPGTA
ncbi:MAG: ribbon-helix-helix domain-containing protein [Alphaproteobacteria bacterium]|nr:ribbon-helix-helix domain-containing protein [Alphaproteobacteria bacterium]